jgi:RNA polymerase sigma-70 factor (ECF subfamily)
MPNARDAHALAALVLLHDSRRRTRVDADGALVPLDEQDRSQWDRARIARGLQRLELAAGATGPYLPQAVIAALHATAPSWDETDWTTICAAYDRLLTIADSPVARANRALAVGFRDGFDAGLAALDTVADDARLARSGTVPSIRADLLRRAAAPTRPSRGIGARSSSRAPIPPACFSPAGLRSARLNPRACESDRQHAPPLRQERTLTTAQSVRVLIANTPPLLRRERTFASS